MDPLPDSKEWVNRWVVTPLVLGLTFIAWVECLLESLFHGRFHVSDPLTTAYLAIVGAYIGGTEARKWAQKELPNPADDPWLERAQRSGALVILWWGLYLSLHIWQDQDPTVILPPALKQNAIGVVYLLIGKRTSRAIRHSRRGVGGPEASDEDDIAMSESVEREILEAVKDSKEGLTLQELVKALPDYSRRHITRSLNRLMEAKSLQRTGTPRSRDARYKPAS